MNRKVFISIFYLLGYVGVINAEKTTLSVQTTGFKHPVLDCWRIYSAEDRVQRQKKAEKFANELMTLSDDQVRAIIPNQTPTISDLCPVCSRKNPQPTRPQQIKPFPVEFNPLFPDQIVCKKCGTVFPNADFPLKTDTFQNMLAEDVIVYYYEDVHLIPTQVEKAANKMHRLYLRGLVDAARKNWLIPRLTALAELYICTHEERYIQRVILVLDEFSKKYPHYLLTTEYGLEYVTAKGRKSPYGYVDTRWGRRSGDDLPQDLLELFDLAASSTSMNADTKKRIIDDLFMGPLKRAELWESQTEANYYGNLCLLKSITERALVLEDVERIHLAYNIIKKTPQYATSFDGMYSQSMGYSSLFRLTFFQGARLLNGYSDPQNYIAKDGLQLKNIYPMKEMEDYFSLIGTAFDKLRLPSGGWLSYDDSGPGFGTTWWSGVGESCRPLKESNNVLLPGLRRAVLGAGTGDKQIQVALDFAEHGINHGHQSGLTMQIYAFGHSLIDDFPYNKSVLRLYGSQTVSHPTVVIDYQNQQHKNTSGDVELYAPLMDGVSAIRVDNKHAYNGLATKYTRSLILNSIDPDLPYVIDIFEVAGGTTHDYMLRSSGQHHSSASSSIDTQPIPGQHPLLPIGERWIEPRLIGAPIGSGYGLFYNASKATINGPFNFTSECDKPWETASTEGKDNKDRVIGAYLAGPDSWQDRPAIGIRHHVAVAKGYELINAETPSLVEMGFSGKEDLPIEKWIKIPHRIVRHQVKAGDTSVFVVVHEPYYKTAKISSVTRLDQGNENLVALRIESPGRVDTLVYALDKSRKVTIGGITMSGRISLISRRVNQPSCAYLIEGTQLKAERVDINKPTADYSGSIIAAQRCWNGKGLNRFKIDANTSLPYGDTLRGSWMLVKLGPWKGTEKGEKNKEIEKNFTGATQALEIDHVSKDADGTWVYIQGDHGLTLKDNCVEEFYWPNRTFSGQCKFIIPTATTTTPRLIPPRPLPIEILPIPLSPKNIKFGAKITSFSGNGNDQKSQNKISEKLLRKVDEANLESMIVQMQLPGSIRMEGYLQVPADGIYTFYFGASDEYRMSLAGKSIIETFRGRNLMPDKVKVKLTKGFYPLIMECFRVTESRIPVWAITDWEGPGLPRQDFIPALITP